MTFDKKSARADRNGFRRFTPLLDYAVYTIDDMILTEEDIKNLPIISEEEDDFYAPGEFEAAVLADFNEEADRIDEKYRSRADSLEDRTIPVEEFRQAGIDAINKLYGKEAK